MTTRISPTLQVQRVLSGTFLVVSTLAVYSLLFFCNSPFSWKIRNHEFIQPVIFTILVASCLYVYFKTMFSSPGYVDEESKRLTLVELCHLQAQVNAINQEISSGRTQGEEQEDNEEEEETDEVTLLMDSTGMSDLPPDQHDDLNNLKTSSSSSPTLNTFQTFTRHPRFCVNCILIKPAYTKHCYTCQHCVSLFDHHCPFMGTCIGGRNHGKFWLYCCLQTVVLWWGLTQLQIEPSFDPAGGTGSGSFPDPTILPAPSCESLDWLKVLLTIVVGFWGVIGTILFVLHTYLGFTNQTTYQLIQRFDRPGAFSAQDTRRISSTWGSNSSSTRGHHSQRNLQDRSATNSEFWNHPCVSITMTFLYNFQDFLGGETPEWTRKSDRCLDRAETGLK